MFTLELVWPTSQVEPGSMGWREQKNNQKTRPRWKILTLEIARFDTGLTHIEVSMNRNRWLRPGLPEVGNHELLKLAWKGALLHLPYSLQLPTTSGVRRCIADVFDDFLWATTVAYYRHWHPPWWSKVTGHWHKTINFRVQYTNLPMRNEATQILLC